jgi:hypothetical protein
VSTILNALAQSDSSPIFRFTDPGDRIAGTVIEPPKLLPVKEFGSENLKVDANGQPVQQVMVVLATEHTQDAAHDGRWRVYFDKALLKQALYGALKASKSEDLLIGDDIAITYTGKTVLKNGREAKGFEVTHSPAGAGEIASTEGAPY